MSNKHRPTPTPSPGAPFDPDALPYIQHSGRGVHVRDIRADGWREFLIAKGWAHWGGYSRKMVHGSEVMLIIQEKRADVFVCRFERKADYWAKTLRTARAVRAREQRQSFRLVSPSKTPDPAGHK